MTELKCYINPTNSFTISLQIYPFKTFPVIENIHQVYYASFIKNIFTIHVYIGENVKFFLLFYILPSVIHIFSLAGSYSETLYFNNAVIILILKKTAAAITVQKCSQDAASLKAEAFGFIFKVYHYNQLRFSGGESQRCHKCSKS